MRKIARIQSLQGFSLFLGWESEISMKNIVFDDKRNAPKLINFGDISPEV
jgi:hypothetical protein